MIGNICTNILIIAGTIFAVGVMFAILCVLFQLFSDLRKTKCTDETIVKYGIKPIENATISKMENVPENSQSAKIAHGSFSGQRRWIGRLCRFRQGFGDTTTYGILSEIFPDNDLPYYKKDTDTYWKYCEPVNPTDSVIYKGGDNEL